MGILKHVRGFTLIELLVTLAIAAVLITFSTGFSSLIQRNQLITTLNTLVNDMNFARSEAIKTGTEVVICATIDGERCSTGDQWQQGWMVYYDQDGDRLRDNDEPLTRRQNAFNNQTVIEYSGRPVDNYIRFQATGSTQYNGTFSFCSTNRNNLKRALILSNTGRLRTSSRHANGGEINCPS